MHFLQKQTAQTYPPSVKKRSGILMKAREQGNNVYVAVAPTYPGCDEHDLRGTLKAIKELDRCTVFMEPNKIRADNVG
jgi:DNA repair photolyase